MSGKQKRGKMIILSSILLAALAAAFVIVRLPSFGRLPQGERLERIRQSPNYRDGRFRNQEAGPMMTGDKSRLRGILEFLFRKREGLRPQDAVPAIRTDLRALDPKSNLLVWFGHSSYLIQAEGRRTLVDPVFRSAAPLSLLNRPFKGTDIYRPEEMPDIDYLIVTHDHWDHLDYRTVRELRERIGTVICPLGVMQDVISWASGKRRKHRNRFAYSPALTWLRRGMLVVFVAAMLAGIGSLLAPYSAYGRIASNLLAPVYAWGNNLLAYIAERMDSYAFYSVDVWMKGLSTFLVAVVTFVVLFILAWRNGRTYCNTICPVGTVLGFLARYSLFKPRFDVSKCNGCKLCARNCKASCIDPVAHKIDYSRCVVCMDCIDTCHKNAIAYELRPKTRKPAKEEKRESGREENPAGLSRRSFLSLTGIFAAHTALRAQEKLTDGGLAVIEQKKIPRRATPIVPAGAASLRNMAHHCTGCQLCVAVCPNGVLRPSEKLTSLMQPEMSYERGYCRPECTKCAEVCPAGAIRPITKADKSAIQIGHAVWIKENCICITDDVECGNCARHCPVGAIQMVASDPENPESRKIPVVNTERCIGCGACENLCPSRPFSAIYVEGDIMQRTV